MPIFPPRLNGTLKQVPLLFLTEPLVLLSRIQEQLFSSLTEDERCSWRCQLITAGDRGSSCQRAFYLVCNEGKCFCSLQPKRCCLLKQASSDHRSRTAEYEIRFANRLVNEEHSCLYSLEYMGAFINICKYYSSVHWRKSSSFTRVYCNAEYRSQAQTLRPWILHSYTPL